jgi:hypothetical protein
MVVVGAGLPNALGTSGESCGSYYYFFRWWRRWKKMVHQIQQETGGTGGGGNGQLNTHLVLHQIPLLQEQLTLAVAVVAVVLLALMVDKAQVDQE